MSPSDERMAVGQHTGAAHAPQECVAGCAIRMQQKGMQQMCTMTENCSHVTLIGQLLTSAMWNWM